MPGVPRNRGDFHWFNEYNRDGWTADPWRPPLARWPVLQGTE
jgi:hypothetical protein